MKKEKFDPSEENLLWLSEVLVAAEDAINEGMIDRCLE